MTVSGYGARCTARLDNQGKHISSEGYTYEGAWIDGMKHGQGKFVFSDNQIYEGNFVENRKVGFGRRA